jgi:aminoglycoside phosphotransferase family enzyme/predicted kinase
MNLTRLIDALSSPAAYSDAVDHVEVRQTHISVVFLAGRFAYKIKKPVDLGFLDFRTLDKRRHFCTEEVRLNRRLAPSVYLGVVPVKQKGNAIQIEGDGELIEWAVKMLRLPDDATFLERLRHQEIGEAQVKALAARVASFHACAEGGPRIAAFGRFDIVARNARENFEQSRAQVGVAVSRTLFERIQSLTEETLARRKSLIEARAERGVPRDTHGDLHLDHVYLFPEAAPPADLIVIDCIEFNERFRFADPVADMAFLAMDFAFHGRRDLADVFTESYFQHSADQESRELTPFYIAYRAAIRAKVEGFKMAEPEVPEAERAAAMESARAHWLLALTELERPGKKPVLVLVAGLPGTGKSTLAKHLAAGSGFHVIRSDEVRKELTSQSPIAIDDNIYSPVWTERTYAECRQRAGDRLFDGQRVIVDANFREEKQRAAFFNLAQRMGVPVVFLHCQCESDFVRQRLQARRCDVSDADWKVYQLLVGKWQQFAAESLRFLKEIDTSKGEQQVLTQALTVLRNSGLAE